MANGNENFKDFNKVQNWILHVFDQKEYEKGVSLRAGLSGGKKKNPDGTDMKDQNGKQVYAKTLPVEVWVDKQRTQIQPGDYTGKDIKVSGSFFVGDYTSKKTNQVEHALKIFADVVEERPRNNNGNRNG